MNYIQRLFDSAAPMGVSSAVSIAPPLASPSPVGAADQRLGVFPDLIDSFAPDPGGLGFGAGPADTPVQSPGPAGVRHLPRTEVQPAAPQMLSAPPAAAESAAAPRRRAKDARPSPVSPLQMLAERFPLPDRHTPPTARFQQADRPPETGEIPALAERGPVSRPPGAEQPKAIDLPPPFANPARITPDQFTPNRETTVSAAPLPGPAAFASAVAQAAPEPASRPAEFSPPAFALQPAKDTAPSPFSRVPAFAAVPLPAAPQASARPQPERIIERIREIPVAPPVPPKAMTAAAQSVIGPLAQRRSGGWQPRQEGY